MAEEAKKTPALATDTQEDNESEYPQDLTVYTHERTPMQRACRGARHCSTREDLTEAQRIVEEDMARRRKTVN